jgi:tetratricopeptide (TPR) repeat protein
MATFALALGARAAWVYGADEPITQSSSLAYASAALGIAEEPHPVSYVLHTDVWRRWGTGPTGRWTLAPLYQLFAAAVLRLAGPHLRPLQLLQCLMDAATAVAVGALGRSLSARYGTWAGLAYAIYWPAVAFSATTMTENLHTPLLVAGLLALRAARAAAGGLLLGLSALARAVSAGFVPLAALWEARRRGLRPAAMTVLFAALAVGPWTARNVLLTREPALIETVSIYNLWNDNAFVDEERYESQARVIMSQETLAGRRAEALRFVGRGLVRHPRAFATKVWENLRYFLRPVDLHQLLVAEYPMPAWQRAAAIALGDGLFLATIPALLALLVAGRRSASRELVLLWCAYYLFLIIVVFHVETRYRSAFTPIAMAGAAGGLEALHDPERRRRARAALAAGLLIVASAVAPYVEPAWRAAAAAAALRPARAAIRAGDLSAAEAAAYRAASYDHESARPWLTYGRWLAQAGRIEESVGAYRRAAERRSYVWQPILVLPRLLAESGRPEESLAALGEADALSWNVDPSRALDVAWRELPPPRTNTILLARGDYGAVRGFYRPERDHRWSRGRAWLRLIPLEAAREYVVRLQMSCPEPAPWHQPAVRIGGLSLRLDADTRSYTVRAAPRDGVLLIELRVPTWSRSGHPLEQGVRVDRVDVEPAA